MQDEHPTFQALAILLPMCDGAKSLDDVGLNKIDSADYRNYGVRNPDAWAKRLSKYRRQIGKELASKLLEIGLKYKEQKEGEDTTPFIIDGTNSQVEGVFTLPVHVTYKQKDRAKKASEDVFGFNVLKWNSPTCPKGWCVHVTRVRQLLEAGTFVLQGCTLEDIEKTPGSQPPKREPFVPCPAAGKTHKDADISALMPHQCDGVDTMLDGITHKKAFLNADDMGLGKTLQALATCKALGNQPLIVVCPASARFVWVSEILKWTQFTVSVFKNTVPQKRRKSVFGSNYDRVIDNPREADIFLTSYEGTKDLVVDNPDPVTVKFHTMKKAIHSGLAEWASKRILVCDEMQLAKGQKAQRSQAVYALSRAVKGRIALTGTPIMNRPEELWNILCALGVNRDVAKTRKEFFSRFVYGSDHSALNKLLTSSGWFLRRKKSEVLTLPPKLRTNLILEMDKKHYVKYLEARSRIHTEPLAALTDMQTVANEAKVPALAEILEQEVEQRSIVVQCTRTEPLFMLEGILLKKGIAVETLTGEDNDSSRVIKCDNFQNGKTKIILTTLDSAITLTAAESVYLLDIDWSPMKVMQREDRCYRIGQTKSLTVIRVIIASIDNYKVEVIGNKAEVISNIIDGGESSWDKDTVIQDIIHKMKEEEEQEKQDKETSQG